MNTAGWILFITAVANAGMALVYWAERIQPRPKPHARGTSAFLACAMCVLVWYAVH
jgi:hypothetical protein